MNNKRSPIITVFDEIHIHLDGLHPDEFNHVQNQIKKYVKGHYTYPSFKLNQWDGKMSHLDDEGISYIYMLDPIMEQLLSIGYSLEDVQLIDHRDAVEEKDLIDDSYLLEYGVTLRPFQVESVNEICEHYSGLISIAPAGGKTLISSALIKKFSEYKAIVITKNNKLVKQNHDDYIKHDINSKVINKESSKKEIEDIIENYDAMVMTYQKFNNIAHYFEDIRGLLIYDEVHEFGEATQEQIEVNLSNCPVRVGMSGSLPDPKKNPFKEETIQCFFNHGILYTVPENILMDGGYISNIHIDMYSTDDLFVLNELDSMDDWDWDTEHKFLLKHPERIEAIADFIQQRIHKTNTLILCESEIGEKLAELLELDFINKDTKESIREEYFNKFGQLEYQPYTLIATYGCAGTGLSIDNIYYGIIIDPAKDEERLTQALGRYYRLDGEHNHADIVDVSSNLVYSKNHKRERKKFYSKKELPFTENQNYIKVF